MRSFLVCNRFGSTDVDPEVMKYLCMEGLLKTPVPSVLYARIAVPGFWNKMVLLISSTRRIFLSALGLPRIFTCVEFYFVSAIERRFFMGCRLGSPAKGSGKSQQIHVRLAEI